MNLDFLSIQDIEAELHRRKAEEIEIFKQQILEHKEAIHTLEVLIMKIGAIQPTSDIETSKEKPETKLGPCATRILEIISASRVPLAAYKLQNLTQYSSFKFKQAINDLLAARLIGKHGVSSKTFYSNVEVDQT